MKVISKKKKLNTKNKNKKNDLCINKEYLNKIEWDIFFGNKLLKFKK